MRRNFPDAAFFKWKFSIPVLNIVLKNFKGNRSHNDNQSFPLASLYFTKSIHSLSRHLILLQSVIFAQHSPKRIRVRCWCYIQPGLNSFLLHEISHSHGESFPGKTHLIVPIAKTSNEGKFIASRKVEIFNHLENLVECLWYHLTRWQSTFLGFAREPVVAFSDEVVTFSRSLLQGWK